MYRLIPLTVIAFILIGGLLSCDSNPPTGDCDTCQTPCDTCLPCDTCDTTLPCDTCDTTDPNPNDSTSHAFSWTEYSIPGEVNLTGAAIFGDNSIYVIGTHLHYFNGSTWTKQPVVQAGTGRSLSFPDFTMFGFSPNDIWIVSGGILDHYIGGGVAKEYRPGADGLGGGVLACWGTSSTDMFLVGKNGSISHFDGEKFTKFPQVTTKNLRSVWGTNHNDVWAAGFDESTAQSVLLHFDGISWTEQDLKQIGDIRPLSHALGEVWATDSAGHKIVVASGSLLHRRTGDGIWRSDSGYIKNRLNDGYFIGLWDIRGNNINDFCAAGDGGFISHWNGKTWKRYDELYNPQNIFYATRAMHQKGNTICVAGKKNGQSWIAIGRRKP